MKKQSFQYFKNFESKVLVRGKNSSSCEIMDVTPKKGQNDFYSTMPEQTVIYIILIL